jgi:hypothetical protein
MSPAGYTSLHRADSADKLHGTLTSRNFWLTSFSTTSMPATSVAVAMPLPMSPPPSTATVLIGRAFRFPSVMFVTCAAHSVQSENKLRVMYCR